MRQAACRGKNIELQRFNAARQGNEMNLQAREIKSRKQVRRSAGRHSGGFGLLAIFHLLIMAAILFFIVNYRISLRDDISRLGREADHLKKELHRYDREMEHLKLKKENLCRWSYIRQKIVAYNLPLVYPEPGQVRVVVIDRKSRSAADIYNPSGKMMVTKR